MLFLDILNSILITNTLLVGLIYGQLGSLLDEPHDIQRNCIDDKGDPQACYPQFFNAAQGRKVVASNTCGTDRREKYCVLLPTSFSRQCSYCDSRSPNEAHNADALTDNDGSNWWQSQNLAANKEIHYNKSVTLDISLGGRLHVGFIVLEFKSSMPAAMIIHKKSSPGEDWQPWAYYAYNCENAFQLPGRKTYEGFQKFNEIRCINDYHVPQDDRITFAVLKGRIDPQTFYSNPDYQEWASASDVRIEFKKFTTFGDERVALQDTLMTYYIALKTIKIGARCDCNGHASQCQPITGYNMESSRLTCVCHPSHQTEGDNCERCKRLYRDQPWQPSVPCKKCKCNDNSDVCEFNEIQYIKSGNKSGTICTNCLYNTIGINCETCAEGTYNDPTSKNRCLPCFCHVMGTEVGSLLCNQATGACKCKPGVAQPNCDKCEDGYYSFTDAGCKSCDCNQAGISKVAHKCDKNTGQCICKPNVEGPKCDKCRLGTYGLISNDPLGCKPCFCNGHSSECSLHPTVDPATLLGLKNTIIVNCPTNMTACNVCQDEENDPPKIDCINYPGPYGTLDCLCQQDSDNCQYCPRKYLKPVQDLRKEKCVCPDKYEGDSCERCKIGYYKAFNSPYQSKRFTCIACQCNGRADSCDPETGQCKCKDNTGGLHCERCADGYYETVDYNTGKRICTKCPCPDGATCREQSGLVVCENCPDNRAGRLCETCKNDFYGDPQKGISCRACDCSGNIIPGAPGNCDVKSGKCLSCQYATMGDHCELCKPGHKRNWQLANSTDIGAEFRLDTGNWMKPALGCSPCDCSNFGTQLDSKGVYECDPDTGTCLCLNGVIGDRCHKCKYGYWDYASNKGCKKCSCHPTGSKVAQCDDYTGLCECHPNVVGDKCDMCYNDYYNLDSGKGCEICNCNPFGSINSSCDLDTGACQCKPIARGLKCDECLENHFDLSKGCIPCDKCYDLIQQKTRSINSSIDDIFDPKKSTQMPKDASDAEKEFKELSKNLTDIVARVQTLYLRVVDLVGANTLTNPAALRLLASAIQGSTEDLKLRWNDIILAIGSSKTDNQCLNMQPADDKKKIKQDLEDNLKTLQDIEADFIPKLEQRMDLNSANQNSNIQSTIKSQLKDILDAYYEIKLTLDKVIKDETAQNSNLALLDTVRAEQIKLIERVEKTLDRKVQETSSLILMLKDQKTGVKSLESRIEKLEMDKSAIETKTQKLPAIQQKLNNLQTISKKWNEALNQTNQIGENFKKIQESVRLMLDSLNYFVAQVGSIERNSNNQMEVKAAFTELNNLLNTTETAKNQLFAMYQAGLLRQNKLTNFRDNVKAERENFKKQFGDNYDDLQDNFTKLGNNAATYLDKSLNALNESNLMKTELDKLSNEVTDLINQLKLNKDIVDQLSKNLEDTPDKLKKLEDEVFSKIIQFNNVENSARTTIEQQKRDSEALSKVEDKMRDIGAEINLIRDQLSRAPDENVTNLEGTWTQLKSKWEMDEMEKEIRKMKTILEDRKNECDYLEVEYNELSAHLDHLRRISQMTFKIADNTCIYAKAMDS